jgi:hypothetical protein
MAEDRDDIEADEDVKDNPTDPKEPKSSKGWLAMIAEAEKAFHDYQLKADNIDKLYANLERLASTTRDRQFALFWANISVLGPSIYSRPPVPVVVPRFKDRKELPRVASELLERSAIVTFELESIDGVMRLIRDDLVIQARGAAWLRYEAKGKDNDFVERVCIDHADRKDFLHDPARTWKEVDWVAKRAWLTKREMRKRFHKTSGNAYKDAAYEVRRDGDSHTEDGKLKAGVWEIWSKSQNKVVWVSEGCTDVLDEDKPHLTLEGFFPCPRPAYATVERRSLKPVPDMVFYKDQLEEINELTARIAALTDAIKVRGFYPAGAGEIGDAIEAAIKNQSDNKVLIPISNWAMIGQGGVKDMIVWLPLEMIVATVKQLVDLRKQTIDDVYQITGLSDIMRGSTVASETLGAQQLKSQYGSIRIRDRQDELTRVARDITRIAAEIMAENFQSKTLLDMSQMEIATDAEIKKKIAPLNQQIGMLQQQMAGIEQEVQQAQSDPEVQQLARANPAQAKQVITQVQGQAQQIGQEISQLQSQVAKLQQTVTIEQVMKMLREQKIRPFVLDIETDSTIAPDENAAKQRATEAVTALGGYMEKALPLVSSMPQAAPVVADTLKFFASQFRAGRQLEGTIDQFADQMKQMAEQPKGPNPAVMKEQADQAAAQAKQQQEAQAAQAANAEKMANAQATQAQAQKDVIEAQSKAQDDDLKRQVAAQEAMDAADARRIELEGKQALTATQIDLLNAKGMHEAEQHAQAMDKGMLEIELLKTKIDHSVVSTAGTVAKTQATVATGEKVANPENSKEMV